jgi:hypothetical protein
MCVPKTSREFSTKSIFLTKKPFRFGLGAKIENLFIDILKLQFLVKFDLLKFLWKIIALRKKICLYFNRSKYYGQKVSWMEKVYRK